MAIRDEVRILKNNTIEELRQKNNELSIRNVGDDKLLSTNLGDKTESFTAASGQKFFELAGRFEILPEITVDKTTAVAESYRTGAVRITKQGSHLVQGLASADFKVPNYSLKVTLTGSPTIPAQFVENAVLTQSGGFSGTLLSADSTTLRFKSFTGTLNTAQNLGIPHTDASKRVVAGNIASKTDIDIGHGSLIELITGATSGHVVKVISTSLVDAVNELQDDVGIVENLATGQKVLTLAINEHETDLYGTGNATFSGLSSTGFQDAIEELRTELGAHTSLGTNITSNVVGAVNELETAVRGTTSNYTLNTNSNDLVGSINEHESDIGDMALTTTAQNLTDGINELDAELGTITAGAMGTTASTVSSAIAEHETQLGNVNINSIASGNNTITGALSQLHTELGSATLNTNATTHTGAINELELGLRGTSNNLVAADLSGMTATNIVSAILEHEADIGDMTFLHGSTDRNELTATNISAALQELSEKKLDLIPHDAAAALAGQTIKGNIFYDVQNSRGTFKFKTGTTLDLSDATLLVSAAGGIANFGSAFLNLDANTNQMGIQVDRDHVTPSGSMTNHDVRLQWNETQVASAPDRAWQLIGMADNGATNTADIVTFYNAQDLFANNTETGVAVNWDATAQNFDIVLTADPVITLGGDLSGSATLTNLGSATLTATIAAGSVENSMLASNAVTNAKIANGTIANAKLVNDSIELDADSGTTNSVNLGETLSILGTSGEIETSVSGNTLTVGLPSNVTVGNNLIVTGDLTVQGTNTILNTTTLEVEDTLILTGTAGTEPSTGGFGIETRLFTGTSTPSGSASNVTGTHSLVYNFSTDQWEADGVQLLDSVNSQIVPQVKVNNGASGNLAATDLSGTRDLDLIAGSGLSIAGAVSGTDINVTFTNTDKGSDVMVYKTITADAGGSAVANSNTDTLTLAGGNAITTTRSGDTISIAHDDTSTQASVNNSGNTFIQDVTLDGNGHITGLVSGSVNPYDGWNLTVDGGDKGNIAEAERVSFEAGSGLDVGFVATNNVITFSHADTSSQASVNNSGTTFIQDVTLDTFGHVTGLESESFTLGNGQLTMNTSGTGLSGSDTFTANASGNTTFTVTLNSAAGSTPNTVVLRDGAGDITADLFKTDNAANVASGNITKIFVESGNDGFINYGQKAAVLNFLNVADGATNTTNPNNATLTVSGGTALTDSGTFTADASVNKTITIDHGDTSTQASVNNSGRTYIQDITLDTHGHITAISSATETAVSDTGVPAILSNGSTPSLNSGITAAEVRSLIGAGTSSFNGAYSSLSGLPTVPTNNNQLTNGAGYTTYTANQTLNNNSNVHFEGLMVGQTSAATANTIRCTGDVVAFYSSDERLKDNITPIENSLEKVGQLKGYEFDWNDNQEVYEGHDVGVIAQEVEKVVPEIVETREHDGYKAVKYEKLVPLLINAINELKAEIEELKSINKKV